MPPTNLQDCYIQLTSMRREGLSIDQIAERLLQTGVPESLIRETLLKWKETSEKKRNRAFFVCGTGIAFLSLGCFVALLFFNTSGNYNIALYGLTILGLICVFKGMIDLMS